MNPSAINDQKIQAEIEQLKIQFPQTRDLYREACVLLFFRYGITPTANKLYQYVRKGSMSAPAEALNKFWLDLREKSRIRIERPDLPEQLREAAGDFVVALWVQAQEAAQSSFYMQMAEANEKVARAQREADIAQQNLGKMELVLEETRAHLENALHRVAETEKNHAVDASALVAFEKSLKTLQNERDQLERSLETARQGFSSDLDKVHIALAKAEERYRSLEARSLLEVDRERQRALKLEKDLIQLGGALREQQRQYLKELAAIQKVNSDLKEKLGMLSGQLAQVKEQQKQTVKKLDRTEKKLTACNSKLVRLQVKRGVQEKDGE